MRLTSGLLLALLLVFVSAPPAAAEDADGAAEQAAEVRHLREMVRLLREQVRHLRTEVKTLSSRVKALEQEAKTEASAASAAASETPSSPTGIVGTWQLDRVHLAKILRREINETVKDMHAVVGEEERARLDALVNKTVQAKASRMTLKLVVAESLEARVERPGRDDQQGTFAKSDATYILALRTENTGRPRRLVFTPDASGGLRVRLGGETTRELRLVRAP